MADLKINTDAAVEAAEKIRKINKEIDDGFVLIEEAVRALGEDWMGAAAAHALTKFETLKKNFVGQRSAVLNDYANFLCKQVGEGYRVTENQNRKIISTLEDIFGGDS